MSGSCTHLCAPDIALKIFSQSNIITVFLRHRCFLIKKEKHVQLLDHMDSDQLSQITCFTFWILTLTYFCLCCEMELQSNIWAISERALHVTRLRWMLDSCCDWDFFLWSQHSPSGHTFTIDKHNVTIVIFPDHWLISNFYSTANIFSLALGNSILLLSWYWVYFLLHQWWTTPSLIEKYSYTFLWPPHLWKDPCSQSPNGWVNMEQKHKEYWEAMYVCEPERIIHIDPLSLGHIKSPAVL